ncbi:MAG: AraC family transcriptional regulator [Blautia sp.]|nr:AraC family transcriptional regulator [Blautia sp.]
MQQILLVNSDLSIFEIAGMVGYENQAKFTAMFHKYCGCTPSAFRRHPGRD